MDRSRFIRLAAIVIPVVILAGCSGGGGGGGGSDATTDSPNAVDNSSPQSSSAAAPLTEAASDVPVVGEVIANCSDTGVGTVDTVIDTVDLLSGGSLPTALPRLSDLLDLVDPTEIPVLGGLVPGSGGELLPISVETLFAMVPGGVDVGELPVLGQMPTVCASMVSSLPAGATSDPAILLAALGDPAGVLGMIVLLDGSGVPVGLLLASLPSGLMTGGAPGLPAGTDVPDLDELAAVEPESVPVLGSTVETLLGVLSSEGTLDGLDGVTGLVDSLGLGV